MALRRRGGGSKEIDAKTIREKWDKGVRATREEREIAAVNTAFLENRQWVHWNREAGRLEDVPRDPNRLRVSINRLGPTTDIVFAKLLRRPLQFEVPPTSPDDAVMRAARIGESALADAHLRLGWERVREDHASCVWEHAVGGLMVEWDKTVGDVLEDEEDTEGEGEGEVRTGEVRVRAVSLHEMAFEPGTRDGEEAFWWIYATGMPPSEVQDQFNLAKEPAADARAVDNVWRYSDRGESTPLTMVFRYWERPHGNHPGAAVTVVGDQVVERSKWPFPWKDRLNICLAVPKVRHGKWWGTTPVTDAIGPQALYNASYSSIGEHLKKAGNARLGVPMGSIDDEEELTDEAGEILNYNPINGLKPDWIGQPQAPDWWSRFPVLLEGVLDDALHTHEVSRGDTPPGVESGVALSVLLEADDSPTGKLAKQLAECWGRAASLVLELWEENVSETRKGTIHNPGRVPEAISWTGGDLLGQTTAVVPLEAVVPRSRAAQNAWALHLFELGILKTPHEIAKVADLPDQDDFLAGLDPDSARAQRENYFLAIGVPRTVAAYDDDGNHLKWHRDFMRSERFEYLDPEVQQFIYMHCDAHEQQAAQKAAKQTQAAAVSPIAATMPTLETKPVSPDELAAAGELSAAAVQAVAGGGPPSLPPEGMAPPAAPAPEMMPPAPPEQGAPPNV